MHDMLLHIYLCCMFYDVVMGIGFNGGEMPLHIYPDMTAAYSHTFLKWITRKHASGGCISSCIQHLSLACWHYSSILTKCPQVDHK